MSSVFDTNKPQGQQARRWLTTARRASIVLITTAALATGLVQGSAQAAPRHSVPVKTDEFVMAVSGKGCRVGHTYRINASSVAEAGRINDRLKLENGQSNGGTRVTVFTRYTAGSDVVIATAYSDLRGIATGDCIQQKVAAHRGRALSQMPYWARYILASLASIAIYVVTVPFATAAVAVVTGGAGSGVGAIIGGCIAGALSAVASNKILGRPNTAHIIIDTLVGCLGAFAFMREIGTGVTRAIAWLTESATITAVLRNEGGQILQGVELVIARDTARALTEARRRLGI